MAAAGVAHARTIPRELVHRSSIHEVLLTDAVQVAADHYLFGVQWPRHHVITGPRDAPALDDGVLVETIRQLAVATAHIFRGVPMDARFVARGIGFDWITAPPAFPLAPLNGIASVAVETQRGEELMLAVHFTVDGVIVARGDAHLRWVSPDVFARLRGPCGPRSDEIAEPPPASSLYAELVGRRDQSQIVVEPEEGDSGRLRLRIDPAHPTYFDHPQDCLPVGLTAEAIRQAALLATSAGPGRGHVMGLRVTFRRFANLDRPVFVVPHDRGGSVEVELDQAGVVSAVGSVVVGAHEALLEMPVPRAS